MHTFSGQYAQCDLGQTPRGKIPKIKLDSKNKNVKGKEKIKMKDNSSDMGDWPCLICCEQYSRTKP